MQEARIDLTITMGDTSKTMSLVEARGLYMTLDEIFGNNVSSNVVSPNIVDPLLDIVRTKDIEDVVEDIDKHLNPVVEAAKKVARERTGGCGK